jgi:carbamoyltransferase
MGEGRSILGISCYYHDSAAALLRDGRIVAAAEEERFNRQRFSPSFPLKAINYCLQEGGISPYDIDHIAFYEKPFLKLERTVIGHVLSYPFSLRNFLETMPGWLDERLTIPLKIKDELGFEGSVLFIRHHMAHAASAFFVSPFEEAAILTADGIGEWASAALGVGRGTSIKILKELRYPNSLGLLYAVVTSYLGFRAFEGEDKVMALAGLGRPSYLEKFREIINMRPDGSFRLDGSYFSLNRGSRMYSPRFVKTFGRPKAPSEDFEERHRDIAASLQAVTEEAILKMALHAHETTKMENLCLAGGVFHNVLVNTRLVGRTPFRNIHIHPAAGDSGAALGAAAAAYHMIGHPRMQALANAYLGPEYSPSHMRRLLSNRGAAFEELGDDDLAERVARRIADGRIVAWFQGRSEWGPTALGHRSILADPRNPGMRDVLNREVKIREEFLPYGVSILLEESGEWFDLEGASPFMLLAGKAREGKGALVPSALHAQGTSRIQTLTEENGLFFRVVQAFHRMTGVPMVINTSLRAPGEPIVNTPEEAYACYTGMKIDCLALGNFFVEKGE